MDDSILHILKGLDPEERKRLLEMKLGEYRQRPKAERKVETREYWLTRLSPLIQAINDRADRPATILDDDSAVVSWISRNFPFPIGSGTCEWTQVPSSKTIPVDFRNRAALNSAFKQLIAHIDARDSDRVYVLWHDAGMPALSMRLSTCRSALDLLINVPGQEMHVVSPERGWYIEFDPFLNECNGGTAG